MGSISVSVPSGKKKKKHLFGPLASIIEVFAIDTHGGENYTKGICLMFGGSEIKYR